MKMAWVVVVDVCDACEGKQFWSKEPEYGGPNVP